MEDKATLDMFTHASAPNVSECSESILQGEAKLQPAIILLDNFQSYSLSHLVLSFWRWSFLLFRKEIGGEFSSFLEVNIGAGTGITECSSDLWAESRIFGRDEKEWYFWQG